MTDEHSNHPAGYEKRDASIGLTGIVAFLAVLLIAVFVINLNELFVQTEQEIKKEMVLTPVSKSLIALHAEEEKVLNSYALIDTTKQIYRIPIERAIELTAAEAGNSGSNK